MGQVSFNSQGGKNRSGGLKMNKSNTNFDNFPSAFDIIQIYDYFKGKEVETNFRAAFKLKFLKR